MKSGYIALIGRPNVGKSTLLNHLIGQKISITSRKPQTTRHRILGIKTLAHGQAIYVDTPGMHGDEKKALNRYLNRTAKSALSGVDLILWITDSAKWHRFDPKILAMLENSGVPVLFVLNKIDRVVPKENCLPFLKEVGERFPFLSIVPVSATHGTNLEVLERKIFEVLPEGEPIFPDDQISDRPERFFAAEIIREKLIRRLAKELPYELTVEIERFIDEETLFRVHAIIWVDRESQKSIVIGKNGELLKTIGRQSRADLEHMLSKKVFLNLWVKQKRGWSDDERALQQLGYD
ncbi:MAG: GTPase Era [Gammaproteobacteria bacterium]